MTFSNLAFSIKSLPITFIFRIKRLHQDFSLRVFSLCNEDCRNSKKRLAKVKRWKNGGYFSVVSWRQCDASSCLAWWHWTWHEPRVLFKTNFIYCEICTFFNIVLFIVIFVNTETIMDLVLCTGAVRKVIQSLLNYSSVEEHVLMLQIEEMIHLYI